MTGPDDEPGMWLFADCLLSKWGFSDGDTPDAFLDWCDEHGHPYPDNWHTVLRVLVRTRLLPVLDQRVELVDIDTCHNPIRAETVDGVDVTDCWYHRTPAPTLTPEGVRVPFAEVLRVMREIERPYAADNAIADYTKETP